jgi:hypothetical protein
MSVRHLLLLLLALAGTAGAGEAFSFARLSAATTAVPTVRVTFTQEKHLAILDEPVVAKGLIEISRPLRAVRWEFIGKSVLVFKDGRLRRWGAEGKEESIGAKDQGVQSLARQMEAMLDGKWDAMGEIFTVTLDPGGAPAVTFTPKTPDLARYLTRLEVRFREDLTAPERMLMVAAGDDRTEYRYDPPQLGVELPVERFTKP